MPRIPANAYTNSPLQQPNILLGSLQLLFWLVFRPTAWKNHIEHLDPSLDQNFSLWKLFHQQRWKKQQLSLFVFQVFIILPIFCSLVTGLISLSLGVPCSRVVAGLIYGMTGGTVVGVVYALANGMAYSAAFCAAGGATLGIVFTMYTTLGGPMLGLAFGAAVGILVGKIDRTTNGRAFGDSFDMVFSIMSSISVFLLLTATVNTAFGLKVFFSFAIGLSINLWRPTIMAALLIPWHNVLYRVDKQKVEFSSSLLPTNLAFWDEWQYLPIWGLDKHLLLVLEKNPIEGQAALNYLSTSRQRWAAQAAQIELDARQLEKCSEAHEIGEIQQILTISELVSPADTIFRSFNSISTDTNAALSQTSTYNQRLALTEVVDKQLNNFVRELTKSSDKYAVRFRPIAQRWQNIIDLHLQDLLKESELRQEIDSPYIIGVPVTNRQQLFVGRNDISEKLEKLLLDRRSPPLLLYGQRRTGKTSLLNNLGRLLPTSIIPLFVDLQGSISSAKDHTGFLYNLAKGMINSAQRQRNLKLPPLSYETLATDPFTRFDEWLDNLETALAGNTALLALDEFEVLDRVLNEGRFNENDVLGMLRNLIQHRPTFKVLLAGSHTLDEFQRWSSYLINAQVIHLGYLQEAEARQLIEMPIENFALRYQPPASQRVLDITKGHPFLVQLLCAEIVALKNDQDPSIRRLATFADVEEAIPEALEHGSMFFSDIERNQLDATTLAVLRHCAQQGESAIISKLALEQQFSVGLEGAIDLLLRRELLEIQPAGYCIQLELIRRWFDRL
jgi:hypothetical protein